MKSYEETANAVLERRDAYNEEKKKSRKRALVSTVTALSLALVIGLGIVFSGVLGKGPAPAAPEGGETEVIAGDYSDVKSGGEGTASDSAVIPTGDDPVITTDPAVPQNDAIGWLKIDGVLYVQTSAGGIEGNGDDVKALFMLKEYLGKAEEFEGAYKNLFERDGITGEVYRVGFEDADLVVILSNGGFVFLCEDGVNN